MLTILTRIRPVYSVTAFSSSNFVHCARAVSSRAWTIYFIIIQLSLIHSSHYTLNNTRSSLSSLIDQNPQNELTFRERRVVYTYYYHNIVTLHVYGGWAREPRTLANAHACLWRLYVYINLSAHERRIQVNAA